MIQSTAIENLLRTVGQEITYVRTTQSFVDPDTLRTINTESQVSFYAGVYGYKPTEIGGLVQAGDRQVKIAASSLTFEPQPNDKILLDGRVFNVISVEIRQHKNANLAYLLQIRG